MANLSIKVNIAGRIYPLTIDSSEEAGIMKAAEDLAKKLKAFEKSYSVRDKQDLLAMCALQYANEAMEEKSENNEHIVKRLTNLEQQITCALH